MGLRDSQKGFGNSKESVKNNILKRVSDLVESIKSEIEEEFGDETGEDSQQNRTTSKVVVPRLQEAQKCSENAILQAEKFKATVADPPGKINLDIPIRNILKVNEPSTQQVGMGVSDDDFFHLICHIDQSLKQRIEKGGLCGFG